MPTYGLKLKRPILGGPYQASDGSIYAYSGTIDLGVHAPVSVEMLRFSLQKADATLTGQFNADWDFASAATSLGYEVTIDGNTVVRWQRFGGTNGEGAYMPLPFTIYLPKNAELIINLMNDQTTPAAGLPQANVVLLGNYLDQFSSTGEQVGLTTKPPLLAAMGGLTPTTPKKSISGSQIGGALMEGGW
jgi:hypothetical protein